MEIPEDEIDEALHVAMTVGATRMQVMLNAERCTPGAPRGEAPAFDETARSADTTARAPSVSTPGFQVADVVAQSEAG